MAITKNQITFLLTRDKSKILYPIQVCSADMSKKMTICISLEQNELEALLVEHDSDHALELINKRFNDETIYINKIAPVEYMRISFSVHHGNGSINHYVEFITLSDMAWLVHFLINNTDYDVRDFQRFCPSIYDLVCKKTDIHDGDLITFYDAEKEAHFTQSEEYFSDELCASEDGRSHLLIDIDREEVYINSELLLVDDEIVGGEGISIKDVDSLCYVLGVGRPSGIYRALAKLFEQAEISISFLRKFLDANKIKYTYKTT